MMEYHTSYAETIFVEFGKCRSSSGNGIVVEVLEAIFKALFLAEENEND